jgi:hypothetical protein
MLVKLAESYGEGEALEEYQVQQLRAKVATANALPQVRQAWNEIKSNPAFTEAMYWEVLIAAGQFCPSKACLVLSEGFGRSWAS